jgi:hypothetical protein
MAYKYPAYGQHQGSTLHQKDILMSEGGDGIHSVWRRCDLF